jgi:hypothetical protein
MIPIATTKNLSLAALHYCNPFLSNRFSLRDFSLLHNSISRISFNYKISHQDYTKKDYCIKQLPHFSSSNRNKKPKTSPISTHINQTLPSHRIFNTPSLPFPLPPSSTKQSTTTLHINSPSSHRNQKTYKTVHSSPLLPPSFHTLPPIHRQER